MNQQNISLVLVLVSILAPVASGGVALAYQAVLGRLPANQRARVEQLVSQTVAAVEQANASMAGPEKKQLATQLVSLAAQRAHIAINAEDLDRLIEAAVYSMNSAKSSKASTPVRPEAITSAPTVQMPAS